MLSDRMVDALNKLVIQDAESVRRFKRTIRQLLEIFLRFTHRYWFHEVSDQPQAKELYRMTADFLGNDALYTEIHGEIWDMSAYLEADTLRRQANTVVRLTVVTTFGLIGTVVTGFLGMNLFSLADAVDAREGRVVRRRAGPGHGADLLHDRQVEAPVRFPRGALRRAHARARQVRVARRRVAQALEDAAVGGRVA